MVIKTPERELIERLQQTLREREWRPIETAHKTNRAILVWCRGYKNTYVVTWHNDYNNWVVFGGFGYELSETPTHWMPLPEPPQ